MFLGADDLELHCPHVCHGWCTIYRNSHTPRFTAETLTEDEAATHLQGIWRARVARRNMRRLIREVYVKKFDSSSGKFFLLQYKNESISLGKAHFLGRDRYQPYGKDHCCGEGVWHGRYPACYSKDPTV